MRAIDCLRLQEGVCYFTDEAMVCTPSSRACTFDAYISAYLLLWIPWEEKHNNEEWLLGIHAHVPSPFLACVPLVLGRSPKEIRSARDLSFRLSFFLPSSRRSHPLSSPCISWTYTAFVTRLCDNPLARLRKIFGGGPAGYITNLWIKNNVPTSTEFINIEKNTNFYLTRIFTRRIKRYII